MRGKICQIEIVPVIKIDNVDNAIPLAKALCEGGLPCAEITFRTDAAEEAIRLITKELPDMLVGTGTVPHWSNWTRPLTPVQNLL